MKTLVLILALFSFSAFADEVPCPNAALEKNEITSHIEEFKKDCKKLPKQLLDLIEKPKSCKNWGGKNGPYMPDDMDARAKLERYKYTVKGKKFTLATVACEQ